MFRAVIVRQGERVAVWDKWGSVRMVDGPRRLWTLAGQSIQSLTMHSAQAHQYVVVRHRDGRTQHVRGPAAVWQDPLAHASVEVRDATAVDANEAIVVYRQGSERIERTILRGPALYVPAEGEWVHEFCWHGADPVNHRHKIPRALKFTKLRVIPDQMYFDVEDVRTGDDALIVVKLMIFFELCDVAQMLDQTHDPVADFVNAVSADVIDFVGSLTFDGFKQETEKLSELETYKNLTGRAARIGYRINKVVYRGYQAGTKLQAMHDGAIETRTRLRLESETERQAQELADLKLAKDVERAIKKRENDQAELEHQNRLHRLAHEESLRQKRLEHEQTMRQREAETAQAGEARKRRQQGTLAFMASRNKERAGVLESMHAMQVDLTRYLVSRHQHPDRVLRIEGNGVDTRVHVKE